MIFERFRTRRRLRQIPRLTVDTAEGTVARVVGVVTAHAPLVRAPYSNRMCIGYRIRFDEVSGESYTTFAPLAGTTPFESLELPTFVVRGDAGETWIDPVTVRMELPKGRAGDGFSDGSLQSWNGFLVEHGISPINVRNIDEVCLLPGQAICIAGIVEREASTEPPSSADELGYRDARKTRVWLRSDYERPLLVGRPPD